jgi:ribonuclease P protein component
LGRAVKNSFRYLRLLRLTTKAEFTAVFDERLKINQGWFLALYKKNQQPYPRLGIVVSKRVIKKATSRNYLKRIIREGFRIRQLQLKGLDIVIMVRTGCNLKDQAKLHKELDTLWQRLTVRCPSASSTSSGDTDTF